MGTISTIDEMDLDGGVACLDFVNSGLGTHSGEVAERLHSYSDLLSLARRLGLLDRRLLVRLSDRAAAHPKEARNVLDQALTARSAMTDIFGAIADKTTQQLKKTSLSTFNEMIRAARSRQEFVVGKGELRLTIAEPENILTEPLDVFLLSAYGLLYDKPQSLIKRCGRCQWMFLDQTKSHRRKWCSMKDCGSIVKSGRYYERKKHRSGA